MEIIAIIIGVIALVVAVKRNDETQYKIRLLEQEINKIAELVADLSLLGGSGGASRAFIPKQLQHI